MDPNSVTNTFQADQNPTIQSKYSQHLMKYVSVMTTLIILKFKKEVVYVKIA